MAGKGESKGTRLFGAFHKVQKDYGINKRFLSPFRYYLFRFLFASGATA
jgi:hypothetical protein